MKNRFQLVIFCSLFSLCLASLTGIVFFLKNKDLSDSRPIVTEESVRLLMTEITQTPERQQVALDYLMVNIEAIEPYLFAYLDDGRKLANQNILLLNTFPNPPEKYHVSESKYVNHFLLRFLCNISAACESEINVYESSSFEKHRELLYKWCVSKYLNRGIVCKHNQSQ